MKTAKILKILITLNINRSCYLNKFFYLIFQGRSFRLPQPKKKSVISSFTFLATTPGKLSSLGQQSNSILSFKSIILLIECLYFPFIYRPILFSLEKLKYSDVSDFYDIQYDDKLNNVPLAGWKYSA